MRRENRDRKRRRHLDTTKLVETAKIWTGSDDGVSAAGSKPLRNRDHGVAVTSNYDVDSAHFLSELPIHVVANVGEGNDHVCLWLQLGDKLCRGFYRI